jgi:hypothetical protein
MGCGPCIGAALFAERDFWLQVWGDLPLARIGSLADDGRAAGKVALPMPDHKDFV